MNLDFRWFYHQGAITPILQWRYLMRHSMGKDYWSEWQDIREEREEKDE
jgi:hypothetical protein